jgi:hypothetical protein
MSTGVIIVIVVAVVVVAALAAAIALRPKQRTQRLRQQFGPEYDRTLADHGGDSKAAEQELQDRIARAKQLDIRPLDDAQRERYLADWAALQEQFVDAPAETLTGADALLSEVLGERGYPEQDRVAALSVHHANSLAAYRESHNAATRAGQGEGTTEELRQSFVQFRETFEALVNEGSQTQNRRVPAQRTASAARPNTTTEESA